MTTITSKYQANTRLVFIFQTRKRNAYVAVATPIVVFLVSALLITSHALLKFIVESGGKPSTAAVNGIVVNVPEAKPAADILPLPVRLFIPRIKVNALIEHVTLTADGAMGAPSGPSTVAWYALGPRPGEVGSAVIAGHFGYKRSAAAFDNLRKLKKGDIIFVLDDKNVYTGYAVLYTRLYDSASNDPIVFNSSDGRKYLNLVTCEGVWDSATKNYSGRRVVFSERIF